MSLLTPTGTIFTADISTDDISADDISTDDVSSKMEDTSKDEKLKIENSDEKSADTKKYFFIVDLEAEEKLPRQSLNSVEALNLLDEIAKCSMTISEVDTESNNVGK